MRLRNNKNAKGILEESKYVIKNPEELKGKWNKEFGNNNLIEIEIGCGKGNFIIENALRYPDKNFIGIEMYDTVLMYAVNKIEKDIPNLRFIRMDARLIEDVFDKEIDLIYLNFSDPWPKTRNAKRRLTSDRFLKRYTGILKKEGTIHFKTDNIDLFDFSVETAETCGWQILVETRDLHNSEYNEGNIMTEYEKKFSGLGHKINMMIIKQPV